MSLRDAMPETADVRGVAHLRREGTKMSLPSDPRDLPGVVGMAMSALERENPRAATEFLRWLVVEVCGCEWHECESTEADRRFDAEAFLRGEDV